MRTINVLMLLCCLLFMTGQLLGYEATSKENKSFELKSGGNVTIICDEGFIHVDTWSKNEVKIQMMKGARANSKKAAKEKLDRIKLEIEQSDNRLYIREVKLREDNQFSIWDIFDPDQWGKVNSSTWVDFKLTVPQKANLRLETDEGNVEVSRLTGNIEIEVDEGNVELTNIEFEDMIITLDEGDLFCDKIMSTSGRMNIEVDEGRVRIEKGSLDKLKVESDEGDVILKKVKVRVIDIRSDEGDIEAEIETVSKGRYDIITDEGDIEIIFTSKPSLEVRLETESGRIRSDYELEIEETDDGERTRGTIGSGNDRLEVYSDDGNISLEKK